MPLTPCPDCGREVSMRARRCVNCGAPLRCCGSCGGAKAFLLALILAGGAAYGGTVLMKHHQKCEAHRLESRQIKAAEGEKKATPATTDDAPKSDK